MTKAIERLRVAPAYIAAVISIVSPGNGMPKLSTATKTNTAQYP